jgi:hypothetical protein
MCLLKVGKRAREIGHTAAEVILNSISPFEALINSANFSQTPSNKPSRLFSAKVARKFLTVPLLSAPPVCFSSSAMMADLSDSCRVGAAIRVCSFGSFFISVEREAMAREVLSKADCFTAAVYCKVVVSFGCQVKR